MGMNKRIGTVLAVAALVVVLGLLVAACGAQEPAGSGRAAMDDGKALVEERCSVCHDLNRVESAKKTGDEWKSNVERMVGKGAKLTEAEQTVVIDYLTEAYPK